MPIKMSRGFPHANSKSRTRGNNAAWSLERPEWLLTVVIYTRRTQLSVELGSFAEPVIMADSQNSRLQRHSKTSDCMIIGLMQPSFRPTEASIPAQNVNYRPRMPRNIPVYRQPLVCIRSPCFMIHADVHIASESDRISAESGSDLSEQTRTCSSGRAASCVLHLCCLVS